MEMDQDIPPSRRDVQREQTRARILDAADRFMRENDVESFSVDSLAARADVARRTVFNYFSSLDDVVTSSCLRVMGAVIGDIESVLAGLARGDGSADCIYTELCFGLRRIEILPVVAYLDNAYSFQSSHVHADRNVRETYARAAQALASIASERYPDASRLDLTLLTSALLQGVSVIAGTWLAKSHGYIDARTEADWAELLDHLLAQRWVGHERLDTRLSTT